MSIFSSARRKGLSFIQLQSQCKVTNCNLYIHNGMGGFMHVTTTSILEVKQNVTSYLFFLLLVLEHSKH